MNNLDSIIKRIDSKNWNIIIESWLQYITSLKFPITNEEDFSYIDNEVSTLADNAIHDEKNATEKNHYYTLKGLHSKIFLDAIILLYKGLNALKSAQSDQKAGYKTWSILNYYQSAFFFVKSFLFLNGVWIYTTITSKNVVIDLFPSFKAKKKSEVERYKCEGFFNLLISKKLEHWEIWSIFLRVLNIASELPVNSRSIFIFKQINAKDFAKQRNSIIYHNQKWLFDDLKIELYDTEFGSNKIDGECMLSVTTCDPPRHMN